MVLWSSQFAFNQYACLNLWADYGAGRFWLKMDCVTAGSCLLNTEEARFAIVCCAIFKKYSNFATIF